MSRYDPMNDPGNNPPLYPYAQPKTGPASAPAAGAGGYQSCTAAVEPSNNIQQCNVPLLQADVDDDEDESRTKKDPSTVPIDHLNLDFKECFQEHESTKTIEAYYNVLGIIYKYVKLFTYHFFVFIFGFFLAIIFALLNGVMSFIHVWIFSPTVKVVLLWVYAIVPIAVAPIKAFFQPLVDVHARIFRQIRVHLSGPGITRNPRRNV